MDDGEPLWINQDNTNRNLDFHLPSWLHPK